MAKIIVVNAEGVLCRRDRRDHTFKAFLPILEGMSLVAALSSSYNIAVAASVTDSAEVSTWLKDHGMGAHFSYVVPRRPGMAAEPGPLFIEQVQYLRSCGFAIGTVIDADPQTMGTLMRLGYNGLVFTHPQYARPEWRPDEPAGRRSWADIEAEVERQNRLKAADPRVAEDDETGRFEVV